MGLFDRLRKAFGGQPAEQPEETSASASASTALAESTAAASASAADSTSAAAASIPVESGSTAAPAAPMDEAVSMAAEPAPASVPDQAVAASVQSASASAVAAASAAASESAAQAAATAASASLSAAAAESASLSEAAAATENTGSEAPAEDASLARYDKGLAKSRTSFGDRLNHFLARFRSVDDAFFDELEETLIEGDVGFETALKITDELRDEVKLRNAKKKSDVAEVIVEKMVDLYGEEGAGEDNSLHFSTDGTPTVFLFVGVNGAGKTTTIGKLAHRYQEQGKHVLLAAGDTFRAGATEQLVEWGRRVNVPVVTGPAESDPAAVVYDAVHRAKEENADIVLVDTAGRLQNKVNLMNELAKIKRVITRELPEAPQEVLLVLDGTTGQNALSQAKEFTKTTNVTGIVLTKLDGSAKGGIVLAIRNELHLPVKLVGLGEKMDDLADFDPNKFVYGLFKELIVR
ncbi:signal recognition particle-docking protein FtsY [Schleiferilactobacillus shenzhenensis]|uniref:Signal recognition particle receptor FtsY n=1 Tax=Schleiferilactobacillus shenzhenensis LY-73 TaxID=1231336 RepID=U4TI32_9LACO|nr:signal recognition particle-docking protein FtsY [Schleiferilactobacillus shenzhenensis]ERL64456.1 FtsY [Schleiferilactobacillus shenzhenensis LY-73]